MKCIRKRKIKEKKQETGSQAPTIFEFTVEKTSLCWIEPQSKAEF